MEDNNEILKIIKEIGKDDSIEIIDINDTFKFKCQQCGKCCMHRHDIIVNPFDIYNGAKYLGITTEEFVTKYLDTQLGAESKIPILLLKSNNAGFCPFLEFDSKNGCKFKCAINEAKPGACANHPIGVIRQYENSKTDTTEEDFIFIKVEQCDNSKSDEDVLVKDWVQPYIDNAKEIKAAQDLQTYITRVFPVHDFFKLSKFVLSYNVIDKCNDKITDTKEKLYETLKSVISNTIEYVYVNYDINKPFLEQVEENKKILKDFYELIKGLFNVMKESYGIKEGDSIDDFIKNNKDMLFQYEAEDNVEGEDTNVNN